MFEDLIMGLTEILTVYNILILTGGVALGMVVGVMPGLGPAAGIAILLPLTFGMEPTSAIIMLAAVYYGSMYGGSITSILINTPGEAATVAATFDGYPMTKQGRAGPALVISAVASFVAGSIGAILISFFAPATAAVARTFGPPELFLVVMAGLLMLVVIIGKNRMLGVLSALIGFGMATVGIDVGVGTQRFTFGSSELINGIDFVPVAIGLFGIGEIFHALWRGDHKKTMRYKKISFRSKDFWPTRKDYKDTAAPMARGSFLGFAVGVAPGAGATVASLMSYNVEKMASKCPDKFGKGAVEGVAGPEAANNEASVGAMVPLITIGIPGSGATAVLLAGFLMWGLQPGPLLMEQNPEFAWGLIASMYLGNVMLFAVNIFMIPTFASIARVPFRVLAPVVVVLCTLGSYTVHGSIFDVGIMLVCGLLGFYMRRFGMSPAALVIALVLGPLAEETLRQTMIISNGDFSIFIQRSTSLIILIAIVILLAIPVVGRLMRSHLKKRNNIANVHRESPKVFENEVPDQGSAQRENAGVAQSPSADLESERNGERERRNE